MFDVREGADEATVRTALSEHGELLSCAFVAGLWSARFATHAMAEAAVAAGEWAGLPGAVVVLAYNDRAYDERGWYDGPPRRAHGV